nr:hypothetical protein [Pseudopedobacter sp.]
MDKNLLLITSLENYTYYLGITLTAIIVFTLLIISIITLSQLLFSKNDNEISISRNEFLLTNMFKHQVKERKRKANSDQ